MRQQAKLEGRKACSYKSESEKYNIQCFTKKNHSLKNVYRHKKTTRFQLLKVLTDSVYISLKKLMFLQWTSN